jgi:hypothetical protein
MRRARLSVLYVCLVPVPVRRTNVKISRVSRKLVLPSPVRSDGSSSAHFFSLELRNKLFSFLLVRRHRREREIIINQLSIDRRQLHVNVLYRADRYCRPIYN